MLIVGGICHVKYQRACGRFVVWIKDRDGGSAAISIAGVPYAERRTSSTIRKEKKKKKNKTRRRRRKKKRKEEKRKRDNRAFARFFIRETTRKTHAVPLSAEIYMPNEANNGLSTGKHRRPMRGHSDRMRMLN